MKMKLIYIFLIYCYFVISSSNAEDSFFSRLFGLNTNTLEPNPNLNEKNVTILTNTTSSIIDSNQCSNSTNSTNKCLTERSVVLNLNCTQIEYDFLIYSSSWSTCFDLSKCTETRKPDWRVQGLRPSFFNESRPLQCCSDKQLTILNLKPIFKEVEESWAFDQDSSIFETIAEEWNLHGTCVNGSDRDIELFSKTLALHKKYPIYEWLKSSHIRPSTEAKKYIDYNDFKNALTNRLNRHIQIRCLTHDIDRKISVVDVVNICVDKKTLETIDCPSNFQTNCYNNLIYAPYVYEKTRITPEVRNRDVNYYKYVNYHSSLPSTALLLPAGYLAYKTLFRNKYKSKYGGYPYGGSYGNIGGFGSFPGNNFGYQQPHYNSWYTSNNFANLAPGPNVNYGQPKNFGHLYSDFNTRTYSNSPFPSAPVAPPAYPVYPHSTYQNSQNPAYPPYSNSNNNKNFGSISPYPKDKNYGNPPPYSVDDKYKNYGNPPPYSVEDKNKNYGNPPPYSLIDKNKNPSYPPYPQNSGSNLDKNKQNIYPSLPKSNNDQPSYPPYSKSSISNSNKPSYPPYPTNSNSNYPNNKPKNKYSSSSTSKNKNGGLFGSLFNRVSKPNKGSSSRTRWPTSSRSRSRG